MGGQIIAHQLAHGFTRFNCATSMVRLQHNIFEFYEARVYSRLIPENIKSSPINLPGFESGEQRRFIDNQSPRYIDEIVLRAEGLEYICLIKRDVPSPPATVATRKSQFAASSVTLLEKL